MLVVTHSTYVYTSPTISRTTNAFLITFDMIGQLGMWSVTHHFGLLSPFIGGFLFYNLVLHLLVVFWVSCNWSFMFSHMSDFQKRRLPTLVQYGDLLNSQMDTACYLATAAYCGTKLPFDYLVLLVFVVATSAATLHPLSGFAPFRGDHSYLYQADRAPAVKKVE